MSNTLDEYNKAMAVLDDLAKEYVVWVQQDLKNLEDTYSQACSASGDVRDEIIRKSLFRIAHDMKGQGATFGYELVTDIGNHLCRYIERQDTFDKPQMEAVEIHIKALRQIIDKKLIADGGKEGQDLKNKVEAF
ncbi:MAG: Hpt domain-containing protein [Alphaproteobacteria bacterium]|nr:Hpt domain-containing protein [Alphaproteobacteria bacterium]